MTTRAIDPDVARCIELLPASVRADVRHLVSTLPLDDVQPVIRAAREGQLDDHDVSYLLGRLHESACRRGYR